MAVRVKTLQTAFGFDVRLAKVGNENLVLTVDDDGNRDVKLPVCTAVGTPGMQESDRGNGVAFGFCLSNERSR
jgi:hypothetical protein